MSQVLPRVFSGIQPTGIPHLGNYFGAIEQWVKLTRDRMVSQSGTQIECDTPIFMIADVHACHEISNEQLRDNIISTTASLIALGVNPDRCALFKQSHNRGIGLLSLILDGCVRPSQLLRMTQYKDKSKSKDCTFNLLRYPVLQAADILLYRAKYVPVGQDQLQHLELTRDIARRFNRSVNKELFPEPIAILNDSTHAHRIKSLRAPEKKMSKSDPDLKSSICVHDEPDVILEKCKKALTDSTSEVYYDEDNRAGVSNLMRIYHLTTGDAFLQIESEFKNKNTAFFKLQLAEVLIAKFASARDEFKRLMADRSYINEVLKDGIDKTRPITESTIAEVERLKLGELD